MKLVILMFSLMFLGACASYKITEKTFSKDPNFEFSGGTLHYGFEKGQITNEEKVESILKDFCSDRSFKKISMEEAPEYNWMFIIPWDHKDVKLKFECQK